MPEVDESRECVDCGEEMCAQCTLTHDERDRVLGTPRCPAPRMVDVDPTPGPDSGFEEETGRDDPDAAWDLAGEDGRR